MHIDREDVKTFRISASLSVKQIRRLRAAAKRLGVSQTTALAALAFEHPLLQVDVEQKDARRNAG